MAFDSNQFAENERRKVIARKYRDIPIEVVDMIMTVLNNNGRRSDYFNTCITCTHFNKETEVCKLAEQRPPANVIADGCICYEDFDEIPF